MRTLSRRRFVRNTALAAGTLPLMPVSSPLFLDGANLGDKLELHLFSKHLQFLDWEAAAKVASDLGFSGLDLTVRPKGHVEPEKVKEDLPKAIAAIGRGGSQCKLITTAVGSAENPTDREVLETAASNGVSMYRSNWFRYDETMSMKQSIAHYRAQIAGLAELNEKLGLTGCYQNHAGKHIGASAWELDSLLESAKDDAFGVQYDIRHATVEGGMSWENGLRLLHGRIKSIALKDFRWEGVNGKYRVVNTPIGEGMVDFDRFFKLLKAYGLRVPAILHLEYPLGGAEHGERHLEIAPEAVYTAMTKDMNALNKLWKNA